MNGYLIEQIDKDGFIVIDQGGYTFKSPRWIETVATKEMMESISYKVTKM